MIQNEPNFVWRPDISFLSLTDTKRLTTYGSSEGFIFWLDTQENKLQYDEALRVTISCSFNFHNYPFDESYCSLKFGIPSIDVALNLLQFEPIQILQTNSTYTEKTKFKLENSNNNHLPYDIWIEVKSPFSHYNVGFESPFTGIDFVLKRNTISLLIGGYFVPTSIFALLSMISYFISPEVVPGRMGLLVTLFLIASNVYNSLDAPPGRGFSYVEVWLIGAEGTIFIALLEYGFVLAWQRHASKYMDKEDMNEKIKMAGIYVHLKNSYSSETTHFFYRYWNFHRVKHIFPTFQRNLLGQFPVILYIPECGIPVENHRTIVAMKT